MEKYRGPRIPPTLGRSESEKPPKKDARSETANLSAGGKKGGDDDIKPLKKFNLNRRQFLRHAGAAAFAGAGSVVSVEMLRPPHPDTALANTEERSGGGGDEEAQLQADIEHWNQSTEGMTLGTVHINLNISTASPSATNAR